MVNFLKEPLQRKIFLLVVIFFASLTIVISSVEIMQTTTDRKELALKNQLALRSLGEAMLDRIQRIELDIQKTAAAEDKRDLTILRKQLDAAIGDIEAILRIIQKGGVFTQSVALNLRDRDALKLSISYTADTNSAYLIEAIDLAPKVVDIKMLSHDILENVSCRFLPAHIEDANRNGIQLGIRLKQIEPLLKRSREDANKIFYDSLIKIEGLENEKNEAIQMFRLLRYVVAIAVILPGLIIFFITAGQISRIIMERKRAMDESDAVHQRNQLILRAAKTGIAIYDRAFNIRYVDPVIENRHGDFTGKKCFAYLMGRNEPCVNCCLEEALSSGKSCISLKTLPLDEDRPVQVSSIPYHADDGEWLCAELFVDITERKQIEKSLIESEERLKTILGTVQTGIVIIDPVKKSIVDVNPAASKMIDLDKKNIIGKKCHQFICPNEEGQCPIIDLGQTIDNSERVLVRKDGSRLSIIKTVRSVIIKGREHLLESFVDISARKQAEEELKQHRDHLEELVEERTIELVQSNEALTLKIDELAGAQQALKESKEKYRSMMEAMKNEAYICSDGYRIEYMNPAMIKKIGREAIGETCYRVLYDRSSPCPWCVFDQIRQGVAVEYELESPKDRGYYSITTSPVPHWDDTISKLTIFHDITELKKMEAERIETESRLHQSRKMEAMGTLAGGVAHDFNNILSSIIGFTELGLDDVEKGTEMEDNLQEIHTAGKRAADLVRQILVFARRSDEELEPIQVDIIAKEVLKFIRASIPATIEIKQSIHSDSSIMGNATQVHQIFMNLCTNAAHAMEDEGGIVEVSLQDMTITDSIGFKDIVLDPGQYIEIKVSDTGEGIPPDILGFIFEPYFTTRDPGEGTGMGLATVHGIVEGYGGKITVDSKLGKGTIFTIYLPITSQREENRSSAEETLPSGKESILFVDDEASVAKVIGKIMERLGYLVTIRNSSVDALELFRAGPNDFDLVITDMTMPNMTGDKLAGELMAIRADIPIILCTGFSKKISEETAKEIGIKGFINKPVEKTELAKTIRQVLDGNPEKQKTGCILVVDDEPGIRKLFNKNLTSKGYSLIEASNGKEGLEQYRKHLPDLVITDLVMPEKEGIEMIMELKRQFPDVKVMAISGGGSTDPQSYLRIAKNLGSLQTFTKPIDWRELVTAIEALVP